MVKYFALAVFILHCSYCNSEKTFAELCHDSVNELRALHQNTGSLAWDEELALEAENYAIKLVGEDEITLIHDDRNYLNKWGENLYSMKSERVATCADADLKWYSEYENYNFATGERIDSKKAIGHFTQQVWNSTKKIGVGIATKMVGSNYETVIVAKYSAAGNNKVQQLSNVMAQKDGAVVPKLHKLNKSLCSNANPHCKWFDDNGYCDSEDFKPVMYVSCYLRCGYCD